jgi:hypothetical protein
VGVSVFIGLLLVFAGAVFATKWAQEKIDFDLTGFRVALFALLMSPFGAVAMGIFICTTATVVGSAFILVQQTIDWLDTAVWEPHSIVDVLQGVSYEAANTWADDPQRWLGVHWIFSFLHPLVGGIMLVPIAVFTSSLMTLFCRAIQRVSKLGSAGHQAATVG